MFFFSPFLRDYSNILTLVCLMMIAHGAGFCFNEETYCSGQETNAKYMSELLASEASYNEGSRSLDPHCVWKG